MNNIFLNTLIRFDQVDQRDYIFSLKDILKALIHPSNLTQYYNKVLKSRSWSSLIDKIQEGFWVTPSHKRESFDGLDQYSILELLSAMEVIKEIDQIKLSHFLSRIVSGIETYSLMHQNFIVLELEINRWGEITSLGETYLLDHLPVRQTSKIDLDYLSFRRWWRNRSIPSSREGLQNALNILRRKEAQELLCESLALSLTDHYWIKPVESPDTWEQVNLLHHDFSEDFGNLLFGRRDANDSKQMNLMTPDLTTEGVLRKRWTIINGERYLLKGGSTTANLEVANEVLASIICSRLNIPHISYELIKVEKQYYCACPCFMKDHLEFMSIAKIRELLPESDDSFTYNYLLKLSEALGLPNEQVKIDQMIVLDYLIVNIDRHLNNFGFLRNPVTLEWLTFAPLFDNGNSMWATPDYLEFNPQRRITNTKPFYLSDKEQISLVKDFSWLNLDALDGIEDEYLSLLKTVNFSGSSLTDLHHQLRSALRQRIEKLRRIIQS
jgi:hypothetical protein